MQFKEFKKINKKKRGYDDAIVDLNFKAIYGDTPRSGEGKG